MPTKRKLDNALSPILGLNLKPVANARVIFQLVDETGRATDVWTDGARVAGMLEACTDVNGVFWDESADPKVDVELWANDEGYTPTRYSCRVIASGVVIHDFIGSVPAGARPLSWEGFMANGESLIAAGLGTLYVQHSLAVDDDDFLLASAGRWVKRTLAEVANKLGITTHLENLNNPHQVSKAQVGLGNVDNTADADKPISTLTQWALDLKADLVGGVIPLSQIPAAAQERLVTVANQAARFALTTTEVQNGDKVKELDGGLLYHVVDDTQLGNAAGYVSFKIAEALAVEWAGVLNKPSTVKLEVVNLGSSSLNPQTVDFSVATQYRILCNGSFTLTLSNFPAMGKSGEFILEIENAGSQVITWATPVNWSLPDGTFSTDIAAYLAANTGRTALKTAGVDMFVFWVDYLGNIYGKLL